ncbi:hypothetical protein B0T11DRAFT_80978 [Plectosphaerella cucumerina]|uniref:Uncharacterized protein n=1 Tax=Plectosphaerella cucumerina TaxID=40658 RepID=A0A8K0THD4_9PEZI|nr:hypothetical protein B0T11DRAFT_80978 [Plectosphaerella cucumerina]
MNNRSTRGRSGLCHLQEEPAIQPTLTQPTHQPTRDSDTTEAFLTRSRNKRPYDHGPSWLGTPFLPGRRTRHTAHGPRAPQSGSVRLFFCSQPGSSGHRCFTACAAAASYLRPEPLTVAAAATTGARLSRGGAARRPKQLSKGTAEVDLAWNHCRGQSCGLALETALANDASPCRCPAPHRTANSQPAACSGAAVSCPNSAASAPWALAMSGARVTGPAPVPVERQIPDWRCRQTAAQVVRRTCFVLVPAACHLDRLVGGPTPPTIRCRLTSVDRYERLFHPVCPLERVSRRLKSSCVETDVAGKDHNETSPRPSEGAGFLLCLPNSSLRQQQPPESGAGLAVLLKHKCECLQTQPAAQRTLPVTATSVLGTCTFLRQDNKPVRPQATGPAFSLRLCRLLFRQDKYLVQLISILGMICILLPAQPDP